MIDYHYFIIFYVIIIALNLISVIFTLTKINAMKIIGQLAIILSVYLTGVLLETVFSLPIPGSIIGMLLMLSLLHLKIVKVEMIEDVSNFFLDNMVFFFIPVTVGIMSSYQILDGYLFKVVGIIVASVIITIAITASIVEFIANRKDARNG